MRKSRVRRSIGRKLSLLALAAVAAGILAATSLSLWQETRQYAESKRASLLAIAEVFASVTATAVAEGDSSAALQALRAIGRIPGMQLARIDTPKGRLAQLGWATQLDTDVRVGADAIDANTIWRLLTSRSLQAEVPIVHAGEPVGRLTLVVDTSDLFSQLLDSLRLAVLGGFIAMLVGLLVAGRLQRSITAPLRRLAEAVEKVGAGHDYTARVNVRSDDEVGVLVDGFNVMVAEIRERDRRIAIHLQSLEQEVADRTLDLSLARDVAEAANSAKSDFLATMSHEIRTPMNGIMVMAELLAAADLPDRQRRYAEVISRSGQSLLAIINDILDLSKIEAGKLEIERIEVSPSALVEDVTSLFGERAQAKHLDLAAYVSADVPERVLGDPVRVGQILGNLVNNALKFTERGHVLVTVAPGSRMPHSLRFSVTDTGIGIPSDKTATIFGAFSQADQSTTRRYGGTGLGLAISKRLIEAMGGEVEVESTVGEGSTFAFTIPVEPRGLACPAEPVGLARPAEPVELACLPTLETKPDADAPVALIAVSGTATEHALKAYFKAAGYRPIAAGPDFRLGADELVDVVVADAARVATLAKMQAPHARSLPVICLAGLGDTHGEKLMRSGAAAAVISRPLVHSEIASVIRCLAHGEPITVASARAEEQELPRFDGLRALVADDSAVNREVVVEALSRLGISVDAVENGRQAVDAIEGASYDIVLLDGSMPEMDGFEACRHIRAAERATGSARLPIVALTAHVIGTAADAWREAGMDAIVHKPFTIKSLVHCFVQLLPDAATQNGSGKFATGTGQGRETGQAERTIVEPASELFPSTDSSLADLEAQLQAIQDMGGTDFVHRVCGLYVEHAPVAFAQLENAVRALDPVGLAQAAHALKSMSFSLGVSAVAELAGEIETIARDDRRVPTEDETGPLRDLLTRTLAQIKQLVEAAVPARQSDEAA